MANYKTVVGTVTELDGGPKRGLTRVQGKTGSVSRRDMTGLSAQRGPGRPSKFQTIKMAPKA